MKEKNEENDENNRKIMNFMEISMITDKDLAIQYLISADWNESIALNNYYSDKNKNNSINKKEINPNITQQRQINNNSDNNEEEGFFRRYFISPIMSLFSSCVTNFDEEYEDSSKIFQFLPNKLYDFTKFNQYIKKYLGIIIFYDRNNLEFLKDFINQICRNSSIMNILKQNCVIYPVLSSSPNGYQIQNIISDSNLSCPSIIFCHNNTGENIFGKDNIFEIINGEFIIISKFYDSLVNSLTIIKKDIKLNEDINTNIQDNNNNFNILTDGEILQKQKKEMEELERHVQDIEDKINVENSKEKERYEKIEKIAEEFKKKFENEPDKDNPDCCIICFRYPDGEKRKDRRFLKNDKIKDLYDYVKSLGNEIYTEEGTGDFSLYQPFPPKKYEIMENTLESEGLFPNAVIQIREE